MRESRCSLCHDSRIIDFRESWFGHAVASIAAAAIITAVLLGAAASLDG